MNSQVASAFAPSWTTGTLIRLERHPGAQPPDTIELLVEQEKPPPRLVVRLARVEVCVRTRAHSRELSLSSRFGACPHTRALSPTSQRPYDRLNVLGERKPSGNARV